MSLNPAEATLVFGLRSVGAQLDEAVERTTEAGDDVANRLGAVGLALDGRPVNLRDLSRELNVDVFALYEAYRELARQRGSDPLLDRARQRYAAARRAAAPRR